MKYEIERASGGRVNKFHRMRIACDRMVVTNSGAVFYRKRSVVLVCVRPWFVSARRIDDK